MPRPTGPPSATPTTSHDNSIAMRTRRFGAARCDRTRQQRAVLPIQRRAATRSVHPAPSPIASTASRWMPIRTTIASGTPTDSSMVAVACITTPTINGEMIVPGPGRRPSNHDSTIIDPTTSHTVGPSGSPERTRTAPMNTSSGPGPSPFHSVTATATAIVNEPATSERDTNRESHRPSRWRRRRGPLRSPVALDHADVCARIRRRRLARVGARRIDDGRTHLCSIGRQRRFSSARCGVVRHRDRSAVGRSGQSERTVGDARWAKWRRSASNASR